MIDKKYKVQAHGYYKVLEEGSAINVAFHWEGKRIAFPHWDFKLISYSVPEVQILFSTAAITFEPPEDFDLEYFLDAFQVFQVSNIYQKGSLKLTVDIFSEAS